MTNKYTVILCDYRAFFISSAAIECLNIYEFARIIISPESGLSVLRIYEVLHEYILIFYNNKLLLYIGTISTFFLLECK